MPYRNENWLYDQYIVQNRSQKDIADECNISYATISRHINKYAFANLKDPRYVLSKELLEDLYIIQLKTIGEIALDYGCCREVVTSLFNEYNIHIRSGSESMNLYYNNKNGREQRSIDSKRLWMSDEYRNKRSEAIRKLNSSDAYRIKASARMQGIPVEQWDGFIKTDNEIARKSVLYQEWRKSVFDRDDYTCRCCGNRTCNGNQVVLHAHHIENFHNANDLRFDIDNGISLCDKCHSQRYPDSFHSKYGTRNNTREQLDEYIRNRRAELSA